MRTIQLTTKLNLESARWWFMKNFVACSHGLAGCLHAAKSTVAIWI